MKRSASGQKRRFRHYRLTREEYTPSHLQDVARIGHKKTLLIVLSILIIGTIATATVIFSIAVQLDSQTIRLSEVFPEEASRPVEPPGSQQENILLLGTDTRGSIGTNLESTIGSRSDTIMIAHFSSDRAKIQVISLMRDSWVEIPGYGQGKLNWALSYGGVPLTVQTIENLLSLRIDHVAIVDFSGFKGLTNAIGGVTVNNPRPFTASGTNFPVGKITLDGSSALVFVRERAAFTDADFQRVKNQQVFIEAAISKVLTMEVLSNPLKVAELLSVVTKFVAVDSNFNSAYVTSLGASFVRGGVPALSFSALPTLGTGRIGDQSVVLIDYDTLGSLSQVLRAD